MVSKSTEEKKKRELESIRFLKGRNDDYLIQLAKNRFKRKAFSTTDIIGRFGK